MLIFIYSQSQVSYFTYLFVYDLSMQLKYEAHEGESFY